MKATEIRTRTEPRMFPGMVYCPICTHTVPANVLASDRAVKVVPGQKCSRCNSVLDVASVLHVSQAA